ncbi:MAG: DUF4185 domain-containing protein [Janthinobacterium lividum]
MQSPPTASSLVIPTETTCVARVTGASPPGEELPNPNQTDLKYQLYGTDLGILWATAEQKVMIAFGDSYGRKWGGAGAGPMSADWRSNTLALSDDTDPTAGLSFTTMIQDKPGHAGDLIPARRDSDEHTVIPTAGIAVGTRSYLYFMSVRQWGAPNFWRTNLAGLAYSDDNGKTWVRSEKAVWKNSPQWDDPFQQGAFAKSGGFVYLFGTPNGRQGDIFLARVPQAKVLEKAAYQYWDGQKWQANELSAVAVAKGPAGELSVAYNSFFHRWLMVALDADQKALVLRDAAALTGPWSTPTILVTSADYPGLYGGYIDPLHNDGKDLYFTLSQWQPYNVFWMHSVLKLSRKSAPSR